VRRIITILNVPFISTFHVMYSHMQCIMLGELIRRALMAAEVLPPVMSSHEYRRSLSKSQRNGLKA
jgi:hypothetical protein